jgi:hypothetical protein
LMTGVAKAWEVWRRDVSTPEVIVGLDGGWDVSSQKVLGCEGGEGLGRDLFHQVPVFKRRTGTP